MNKNNDNLWSGRARIEAQLFTPNIISIISFLSKLILMEYNLFFIRIFDNFQSTAKLM